MKALSTTVFLLLSLAAGPVEARPQGLPHFSLLPSRPAVRPLTRYLAAVLHLTHRQAAAVQQALRNYPDHSLAPEDLTLSLGPVLTPEAQEHLQSLQNNATTYQALYYLAARH